MTFFYRKNTNNTDTHTRYLIKMKQTHKVQERKKQSNKIAYLTNLGSVISQCNIMEQYCHSIATHISSEMLKLIENYRIKFFPSKHRKLLSSDGFVVPYHHFISVFLISPYIPSKRYIKAPLFEISYFLCDTEIQGFHNTDDDGISKVTKKIKLVFYVGL